MRSSFVTNENNSTIVNTTLNLKELLKLLLKLLVVEVSTLVARVDSTLAVRKAVGNLILGVKKAAKILVGVKAAMRKAPFWQNLLAPAIHLALLSLLANVREQEKST